MKKTFFKIISAVTLLCLLSSFGCAPKNFAIETTAPISKSDVTSLTEEVTTLPEEDKDEVKFLVFADFHYKKKMYASSIEDLDELLLRAKENDVDFVIHLGDFCNDYIGSPELFDAYLNNKYGIPVYGVVGNHELETKGNSMGVVTSKLTNQVVTFGEGEDIGYWYADVKNFRLIGLDTNYSLGTDGKWTHNLSGSHGAPASNTLKESLALVQRDWLDEVIADASEKGLKVLVFSHGALAGEWYSAPDASYVRSIFNKYPGTVMMASNGHLHTDRFKVIDNVAYFDVNACINAYWKSSTEHHYSEEHTFSFTNYIAGKVQETKTMKLMDLSQGKNTWFLEDPISAVVTVNTDGNIDIKGSTSSWRYGIKPPTTSEAVKARISDYTIRLKMNDN